MDESEEYKILCPRCKTDLTEKIGEMVEPVVKKIAQFFSTTPNIQRVGVKNIKAKTTCLGCGLRSELEVDLNRLAELYLERMK